MNTELQFPSNDKVVDAKIRALVDHAARVRQSYRFIDKQTGNGARRADLPVPKHFKAKHGNGTKQENQQ